MSIKPFLKWAGGKRWLLGHEGLPVPSPQGTYIEPFLGGGAVFFGTQPQFAVLSDANSDLIDTYQAIKDDWRAVYRLLEIHHDRHCASYYYAQRDLNPRQADEKAARFIYLNILCWNGLYRVNKNGQFNVPIGSKNWVISNDDNFSLISSALANAELLACDFECSISRANHGDFVFVDPPYTVAHNHNGFVKYNDQIFSWSDQVRLHSAISGAVDRGATVVMTNADHASITELYQDLRSPRVVDRHSVISGSSSHRRKTTEALYVFGT